MQESYKLPTPQHIDRVISAEIPDPVADPTLYKLVSDFMMHGPCGLAKTDAPCNVKGVCTKRFPKDFSDSTSIDDDGYPVYMRRDNGRTVLKGKTLLDNRYVVGYNTYLLKRYQGHINVEWCNQVGSIKYLFKYMNKGNDRATLNITDGNVDEIRKFYDCRYISACEAVWRIYSFDIHYRKPAVMRLPFHLENGQNVTYEEESVLENVVDKPSVNVSMFLGWFDCNRLHPHARELTYVEFPGKFTWQHDIKMWTPRKGPPSVGRLHHVSPAAGDLYYLRILLNKVKGPTCYDDIVTVNGKVHKGYKDACYALGLLDDDKEYIEAIIEASKWASGSYLRNLYAHMIITDTLMQPEVVWAQTCNLLTDGILYRERIRLQYPGMFIPI